MEKTQKISTEQESENSNAIEGKETAIIAYITIIGLIIAFLMNREKHHEFASYHIKQMLGLAVAGFGVFIIGLIPLLGWILNFLLAIPMLIIWIMGLLNAINGKKKPIPVIGKYAINWFKNVDA